VLVAGEEQALLKAYIIEWRKFFTQSSYLPLPFWQLESSLQVCFPRLLSIVMQQQLNKFVLDKIIIVKSQLEQQLLEEIFQC